MLRKVIKINRKKYEIHIFDIKASCETLELPVPTSSFDIPYPLAVSIA